MSIVSAAGQHGPGDARQFISDRHYDFVVWSTLRQPPHPLAKSSGVVLDAKQYRAGTVDQHATQIDIAALADAVQLLLAPVEYCRGTTPTQAAKSRPRRKAEPLLMAATVAVETSGPKPGICRSCRQRASSLLMRSISSVIAWISVSVCFHSCHMRSSNQRRRGLRFWSASSMTAGRFLRRWIG